MNIDKIKKELTAPIFEHINSLNLQQLEKQKKELLQDIELMNEGKLNFQGNCNDLLRIRNIELNYINYKLS